MGPSSAADAALFLEMVCGTVALRFFLDGGVLDLVFAFCWFRSIGPAVPAAAVFFEIVSIFLATSETDVPVYGVWLPPQTPLRFGSSWSGLRLAFLHLAGLRIDIKGLSIRLHSPDRQTILVYLLSYYQLIHHDAFSVAALLPLVALAVPVLSGSVQAGNDSYGGVDYKGKDCHNDGGSKDYNYGDKNKDNGRGDCTWEPVFEHKDDFKGWNKGRYTPYDHKDVDKVTFEIGKSMCSSSPTSSPQNARAFARSARNVTIARFT
ncbi:hypothetical protein ARMGADRAFT_1159501, partial [Armillaria gallica]